MTKKLLWTIFLLLFFTTCFAAKNHNSSINQKIGEISRTTNTIVGITAIHIESGRKISYNGALPFFMASTAKVPIALTLLNQVDQKQKSLEQVVHLKSNLSIPGSGGLSYTLDKKNVNISLKRLLNLMLVHSDNSASDALLREVNGPISVQQRLRKLGFGTIRISRTFLEIFIAAHGADPALIKKPHTSKHLAKTFDLIPPAKTLAAWNKLENDTRDTTTPDAMALLLAQLYKGKLLSPSSTSLLLRTMEQCKTGRNRIKGLLPKYTRVAHKTGTWSICTKEFLRTGGKHCYGFASDIGIITLPQQKGHLAIAIYVKSKATNDHARTRVIAQVAKEVYDYFFFG